MYFDPVCRQTIEDNALKGNDIGTATHIGMKIKVKCIVDGTCLTKGKIYEVIEESEGLWGLADDEDNGEDYQHQKTFFAESEKKSVFAVGRNTEQLDRADDCCQGCRGKRQVKCLLV